MREIKNVGMREDIGTRTETERRAGEGEWTGRVDCER